MKVNWSGVVSAASAVLEKEKRIIEIAIKMRGKIRNF
jgi:hypothetical protein